MFLSNVSKLLFLNSYIISFIAPPWIAFKSKNDSCIIFVKVYDESGDFWNGLSPVWMFIRIKKRANYVCYRFKFYERSKKPHSFMQTLTLPFEGNQILQFILLVSKICCGRGNQPYNFISYKRVMASKRPVETFVLRRKRKIIIEQKIIPYLSDEILGSKNSYDILLSYFSMKK